MASLVLKFIFINQFYPPDLAPTGQYLADLCDFLRSTGHDVTIVCSKQNYAVSGQLMEMVSPASYVKRVGGRGFKNTHVLAKGFNQSLFVLGVLFALLRANPRPDLVVGMTSPGFLGWVIKFACMWRGIPQGRWVMDVYPDVLAAHGMVATSSFLFRFLQCLERWSYRGSACCLALGPDMASLLKQYSKQVDWVPLWKPMGKAESGKRKAERGVESRSEAEIPLSESPLFETSGGTETGADGIEGGRNPSPDPRFQTRQGLENAGRPLPDGEVDLIFLYSGNMGRGHRMIDFLQAARHLGHSNIRWIFGGAGHRRREVEAFKAAHPFLKIDLEDYVPEEALQERLQAADVHLASMDPAWDGCMVPSKIIRSMASGRPVLFVGSRTNSVALWIEEGQAGWVVPPNDQKALLDAIMAAQDPELRRIKGENARLFAERNFGREINCGRICDRLEDSVAKLKRQG